MPLKRKLIVEDVCASVQTLDGSRFVNCPVCSQKVVHYLINSHLDFECGKSTSSPACTATPDASLLQPPKARRNSLEQLSRCGSPADAYTYTSYLTHMPIVSKP